MYKIVYRVAALKLHSNFFYPWEYACHTPHTSGARERVPVGYYQDYLKGRDTFPPKF